MTSDQSSDYLVASYIQEAKCLKYLKEIEPSKGLLCHASFDDVYCWPPTPAGQMVNESCAKIFTILDVINKFPEAIAFRECDLQGNWVQGDWTNYSQCLEIVNIVAPQDDTFVNVVVYIMFIGSLVSFSMLALTLFVFTCFRSLECDRLRVHRNLVFALLIKFLASLIFVEPFISGRTVGIYRESDIACKALLIVMLYTMVASINWMFVEGFFLHSRLTSNVFDSKAPFKIYYTIGWGLPLIFITWWIIEMTRNYATPCWNGYATLPFTWILVAPMIVVLVVNLFFLVNILRILVTKLRASQAVEATQVRKAVRAAFVLLPLLGIPNLMFIVSPEKGAIEGIYMIAGAFFQSSQGIFVCVMHCFCNGEVQDLFKKRWRRLRAPHQYMQGSSTRRKSTKSIIIPPNFSEMTLPMQLQDTAENGDKLDRPDVEISRV